MRKGVLFLMIIFMVSIALGEVVLQYWFWDPNFADQERAMIREFEKTHPGIKVELTALDPKSYWTKLAAMAAAKKMPDVVAMHPNSVEDLVDQGALVDLTDYILRDFNKEDYFWSVLESSFRVHDRYYAVPFAWVGSVLYYNKDLFDKYGVPYPTEDWTWDDFLKAAKKLTIDEDGDGKPEIWGYMVFSRYAVFDGWILQNGGDYLDRENMRWAPDENAKEAIKFIYELVQVHKVAPRPKDYDLDKKKIKIMFSQQKTAMITEGTWNIKYMREDMPANFNWDIAYIPRGPHWKGNVMHAWADGLAISSSSKHKEEAWEFIKFLIKKRPADWYYPGKVPFYKKEAFSDKWDDWKTKGLPPEHKKLILEYGKNAKHFYTKYWKFWRGYASAEGAGLSALIDSLLNGEITLDEFYKKADREINRMLRKAYKKRK
ncbi:MAG: sugar ABC transporter substrate-binding protein [Thermotoga sp.]|nr:MAG: sugar ABC transporter substrate-binding protein [Thermotoga sp.]